MADLRSDEKKIEKTLRQVIEKKNVNIFTLPYFSIFGQSAKQKARVVVVMWELK